MDETITTASSDKIIFLFSSAPPERPTYKRGALNILCYPEGHQVELSYQKSYFQPPLFDKRESLANRRGAFVFLDYKAATNGDHEFIPIRSVKILDVAPKEGAERYLDTTRVQVRIELGELILYDAKWNSAIASLPGRPKPYRQESVASRGYFYVIEGQDPFPARTGISQIDIWDEITRKIARAKSLNGCVFLATGHLRPFVDGAPCALVACGREQKAYTLQPNSIYRLDLRVYYPQTSSATSYDPEIVVRSSSEVLSVSQPFATAHGGPEDHSVLVNCKRTIESTLATLVVDVAAKTLPIGSGDGLVQRNGLADVVAAKPRYLLSIQPRKSIVRGFVTLIFLGFFLTSTSTEFYSDWAWFSSPEIWAVFSKVAGAICLAWAAFLAFRKLPSGGSG